MNIWYISAYDQPKGISSRTYDFSKELVKRGHKVTMFTNSYCHWTRTEHLDIGEKWRIEDIEGIRVIWLRTIHYSGNNWGRGLNMLLNAMRIIQVANSLLKDKPDVIIGPSVPLLTGLVAAIISHIKGVAFVFEVRDVWPIALVYDGGLSKRNPIYYIFRSMEKYLYRKSCRISATMPFIHQHVLESGGDPKKITWIPNGVDLERYSNFKEYSEEQNRPLIVMYVGGFGKAHDVITIIKSAKIIKDLENTNFRFILIGSGIKKADCQKYVLLNKLTNVEFWDPVMKSEVPRLQAEADILVASVIASDSFRFGLNLNKLYDYLASGKPVIFSGKAPNDPVLESGAGFSIPPENPREMVEALFKIEKMSVQDRIEMGKRGRYFIENNFNICKLSDKMEYLLSQAIKDIKNKNAFRRA
ncbi:MAG: glycosyltransferase family 4 protein [Candidatus Omnitrophota bacterium]